MGSGRKSANSSRHPSLHVPHSRSGSGSPSNAGGCTGPLPCLQPPSSLCGYAEPAACPHAEESLGMEVPLGTQAAASCVRPFPSDQASLFFATCPQSARHWRAARRRSFRSQRTCTRASRHLGGGPFGLRLRSGSCRAPPMGPRLATPQSGRGPACRPEGYTGPEGLPSGWLVSRLPARGPSSSP